MRNLKSSAAYAPVEPSKRVGHPAPVEDADAWVKTSVSMRPATRRRLKIWVAERDLRLQDVLDDAINAYLQ